MQIRFKNEEYSLVTELTDVQDNRVPAIPLA